MMECGVKTLLTVPVVSSVLLSMFTGSLASICFELQGGFRRAEATASQGAYSLLLSLQLRTSELKGRSCSWGATDSQSGENNRSISLSCKVRTNSHFQKYDSAPSKALLSGFCAGIVQFAVEGG